MNIAIIPARGGSKRIPRKNIKLFCGEPMIAWSIKVAIKSGLFDRIIVSTDDMEIANVAEQCGAEVPFTRPAHLADDYTGTTEVIGHAINWLHSQNLSTEAVCCIYATAPFIQTDDLNRAFDEFKTGHWNYVFPATEFSAPVFRSFKQDKNGGLEMFFPEHFKTRSQDLPTAYHDAGQFYWGQPDAWLKGKPIFAKHSKLLKIPKWRVQDIDTDEDWIRAEMLAHVIMGL
ncbi:pseudaminic acid cytidylyltransferase [Thermodesulfobacteriota bacterium]